MPHPGQTYHLIAELLSTLQAEGYPLGTGQQLQVQELLNKLPEDTTVEEMPFLLAPLFANNPKEQDHFYELFEQCRKRTELFYQEIEREEKVEPDQQERRFHGLIWLLVLSLLVPPVIVIYKLMRPAEREFLEKPFQVQAGGQAKACLGDSTGISGFGAPESYEVVYPGRGKLGAFLVDTPQCLVYIAQDSIYGQDSIVLEWSDSQGRKLLVKYKPIILPPEPDTATAAIDTSRIDTAPPPIREAYAFDFKAYPFNHNHDPLAFAVQPPPLWRQFLADNFWWLKWGGLLLFTALLLALLFYRAYRRRKLIAELESKDKPPYAWNIHIEGAEAIHLGDDFSFLLNLIRQRAGSEAFKLDVPRTIGATIEQGGMPTFRFLQQTQPPEYLLLIEQQSARNHRARLLDMLFQVFHANEVLIERFFYDNDPRVCYNEAHPEGISLQEVQQRYPSSRLMVAGYGNALLNKLTGKLEPWSPLIRNWKHRLLLTPRPTLGWGKRERRLSELFTLLPLSMQSLLFWLEELEMEEDARFDAWPDRVKDAPREPIALNGALIPSLQAHFGGPMMQWIAACAVYPSLHWDLTLYLGQQLSLGKENLLTVGNLLQLTRLSWFTEGRIPPATRASLLEWLEAEQPALLGQLRLQLAGILQQNPPPADSAAFEDYRMNVALNEWLTVKNKGRKKDLEQEIGRLMEAGADVDVTVVKQLRRERRPLDFIVPDTWKKYLYPHGLPGLGWRGEWRDVLRWALPLWVPVLLATAWPWQFKPAGCEGALVKYQVEGADNLLCVDSPQALGVMAEAHVKAVIQTDSLAGASAFNGQAMLWQSAGDVPFYVPLAAEGYEAAWQWQMPSPGSPAAAGFVEYNRAEKNLRLIRAAGNARYEFPAGWINEYRSNIAVAFYNKGVRLMREGGPEPEEGASRERVCAYFQEAMLLDSSQLDMNRIRSWCAGGATPDTIPSEACFVLGNVPNEVALRSRPLTRKEADELNAGYGKPGWDQLRVNRETLVQSIRPAEQVQLLEEGADYYYIRHKGVEGYIVKTYQGKPILAPCFAKAVVDSGAVVSEAGGSAEALDLQKIMLQAPAAWDGLKKRADFSWEASGTTFPEIGVRGRYAILKPLLNPAILEKIFGEKVYRSGPHRGASIDYRNEEAFGRYNPAFLKKLYPALSSLSRNTALTKQVQGLYNREFRNILRVFYLAYPVAANQKDIQAQFLSILNTPLEKRESYAITSYFIKQFGGFASEMERRGFDGLEGYMAARFWVRRSVDGTADEFYQLLRLALRTFDPSFPASAAPAKRPTRTAPETTEPRRLDPSQQESGKGKPELVDPPIQQLVNPLIQQTISKAHAPRYLWCLDNPHGKDSPDKRSPVFDDGKTQLFEGELSRDVVQRIIRRLDEIGVLYYLVVPEEEDISLQERARRINNYKSQLPKLAISVHFNSAPLEEGSSGWAKDAARGAEAWHYSSSQNGRRLGAVFLEKIIRKTELQNRFLKSLLDSGAELFLLRNAQPPITQIENGFYNNRADAALLAQPAFRQKLAEAYVEAILAIEGYGLEKTPAPLIDEQDSDGDGLANSDDLCPFTPGPAENEGCPVAESPGKKY